MIKSGFQGVPEAVFNKIVAQMTAGTSQYGSKSCVPGSWLDNRYRMWYTCLKSGGFMSFYLLWIPALIFLTIVWAIIGKHVNENPNSNLFYFLFFAIPVWSFVCRHSKNLLFDSILYDGIMTLVYAGAFIWLGAGNNLTMVQWLGCALSIVGLLLMKAPV